jgi:hypothetical protein
MLLKLVTMHVFKSESYLQYKKITRMKQQLLSGLVVIAYLFSNVQGSSIKQGLGQMKERKLA